MTVKSIDMGMGGCRRAAVLLPFALAGLIAAAPAAAGSFQVSPVQLSLPADRNSTSMTVANSDTQPLAIRAKTFRWTQKNGQDVYEPTDDIIVSPPIFNVPAAGTQLVRLGLRGRTGASAYRVILEEIPRPESGKINVALHLNLPLYLLAAGDAKPVMRWSMRQDAAGNTLVEGANSGSMHLQVTEISAAIDGGAPKILSNQMGVVLPQSARQWNLGKRPDLRPGTPLVLRMRTSVGPLQAQVVPQPR